MPRFYQKEIHMPRYSGGVNRRDLDRLLVNLGGTVRALARTGEIQYSHPMLPERPRADGRRKDAPRHLVAFVHRIERAAASHSNCAAATSNASLSDLSRAIEEGVLR
jgi:hypothetical protein